MARDREFLRRVVALAGVGVVAFGIAVLVVQPWISAPLAFDTYASVVHFDRIVAGRQLEQALSTTPKPLLTLIYGLVHALTQDWRAVSVASLAAWGVTAALGSLFAWRLGGLTASAFMAAGLMLSAGLLLETAWGLASIWALLLWFVAGLAVTGPRQRWGLAGTALGLATLARLETLLLVGLGVLILSLLRFGPRRWRRPVPPGAWMIALALLAVPVIGLHDLLLTGDPLFWTSVAPAYSAVARSAGRLPDVGDVAGLLTELVRSQPAMAVLGVVGLGVLAVRGHWPALVGVVALGPGTAAFLLAMAMRGVFVDERYLLPIAVAMLVSASAGLSAIRLPELGAPLRRWRDSIPGARAGHSGPVTRALMVLAGVSLAFACSPTLGPFDRSARSEIADARRLALATDVALPAIRSAINADPTAKVMVPVPVRPRVTLDLDRPLTELGSYRDLRAWAATSPAPGTVVLVADDPRNPSPEASGFRLDAPATVEGVALAPLLADPAHGVWVLQVGGP